MPNYNYNYVTINAKYEDVCAMFIESEDPAEGWFFTMHRLFPNDIPETDPTGLVSTPDHLDIDWCIDNTGSKWLPDIWIQENWDQTILSYDTAWVPNNLTLLKLSEMTGWWIHNEYEEPWCWFEGTYICEAWNVIEDEQREFQPECDSCNKKHDENLMEQDEETYEWTCHTCAKKESAGKWEKP